MVCHILSRANGRLPCSRRKDYEAFARVLREARDCRDVLLLAYCVMPNHWRLVVRRRRSVPLRRLAGAHAALARHRLNSGVVDLLIGNSQVANAWKSFDLIGNGQTGEALTFLARLFDQGEEPIRLLGAFSMQLRRFAQVARLHAQGTSLDAALEQAGIPPFTRRNMDQHLRKLGPRRLNSLYDWPIETDLGMKGSNQLPPRMLLERLVVQLAR